MNIVDWIKNIIDWVNLFIGKRIKDFCLVNLKLFLLNFFLRFRFFLNVIFNKN